MREAGPRPQKTSRRSRNRKDPRMSDTTGLEAETLYDTVDFDHFDETWTIPTKRHLSHIVKMRNEARNGYASAAVIAAETMLGAEQFARLLDVNPDEDQLDEFVEHMSKVMGLGGSGNSKSSSSSS
jgi:hypothetical protein